jgi:hypothetical protein
VLRQPVDNVGPLGHGKGPISGAISEENSERAVGDVSDDISRRAGSGVDNRTNRGKLMRWLTVEIDRPQSTAEGECGHVNGPIRRVRSQSRCRLAHPLSTHKLFVERLVDSQAARIGHDVFSSRFHVERVETGHRV